MKILEIGLGCDMGYGPGASVNIWKILFPQAETWEAEFNARCVKKSTENGQLKGINTVTGDQGNTKVLDEWIEKSGGNFDVIIDYGGHKNCQIWTSFLKLWPHVNSGGLYFIEDMQVAKQKNYLNFQNEECSNTTIVPDKLKAVLDDLMYKKPNDARNEVLFMFCQSEACVLGKK